MTNLRKAFLSTLVFTLMGASQNFASSFELGNSPGNAIVAVSNEIEVLDSSLLEIAKQDFFAGNYLTSLGTITAVLQDTSIPKQIKDEAISFLAQNKGPYKQSGALSLYSGGGEYREQFLSAAARVYYPKNGADVAAFTVLSDHYKSKYLCMVESILEQPSLNISPLVSKSLLNVDNQAKFELALSLKDQDYEESLKLLCEVYNCNFSSMLTNFKRSISPLIESNKRIIVRAVIQNIELYKLNESTMSILSPFSDDAEVGASITAIFEREDLYDN